MNRFSRLSIFLILSVMLVGGSVHAQTAAMPDPLRFRLARALSGVNLAQAATNSLRVTVAGGSVIPYAGVAVVGSALIMAALANHYNGIADANLDELGSWFKGRGGFFSAPPVTSYSDSNLTYLPFGGSCLSYSRTFNKFYRHWLSNTFYKNDLTKRIGIFLTTASYDSNGEAIYGSSRKDEYSDSEFRGACKGDPLPSLDEILQNQIIANRLADILNRYVNTHPDSINQVGWEVYPNVNQIDDAITNPDIDTDNDGYTDSTEVKAKTDPSNAKSKPTTKPDAGTKTGAPAVPKPDEPKEEELKKKKEPPVSNECGDFSLARALKFPAHVLKDLFIPCDKEFFSNYFSRLHTLISGKFPFGFIDSLRSTSISVSGDSHEGALPSNFGIFTLDWSQFQKLFLFASLFFKSAVSFLGINFLISKLSGQVVIK